MVKPSRPPANGFVSGARKVYNPLGFSKGYNFIFWFITIGYIFGFTLSRVGYFSFYGIFCNPTPPGILGASPGECFYYMQDLYQIGIMLHLYCILPAGILVCFQFVPVIRHKIILFHRINGYLVILLCCIASAGAIIVAEHAFGGDMATRTYVGVLVVSTTVAYIFAWINIKRLQIDQHRAWMMRAWAYFATIITLRLIQISSAAIISSIGGFFVTRPCDEINFVLGQQGTLAFYPGCAPFFNGSNTAQQVIVEANYYGTDPIAISASLGVPFGAAGWMALWIHAIIIELYLHLTPAETERLKQASYERHLEKGFRHPGAAGLVAERLGDANEFVPQQRTKSGGAGEESGMLYRDGRKAVNEDDE